MGSQYEPGPVQSEPLRTGFLRVEAKQQILRRAQDDKSVFRWNGLSADTMKGSTCEANLAIPAFPALQVSQVNNRKRSV